MKSIKTSLIGLLGLIALIFAGCGGGGIDVVQAGTYNGTIDKVVAEEQEIYVTLDNGQQLELYFTEETELLSAGQPVEFSALASGLPVEVTVAREGNRNIPTTVEIAP